MKDPNIAISIIIPLYNAKETIGRCLDSVLSQTLKEVEIICVDDGSIDNSLEVLKGYKDKYPNILILTQKNLGAGPARNRALSIAKGEFICFLDSDDYYIQEDSLKILYDKANEYQVDVCCGLIQFQINGIVSKYELHREYVVSGHDRLISFRDYQYDYFFQCFVFRKTLFEKSGITFPELRRYQDPPFLVTCLDYAECFLIVPVEFYCYQKDDGGFSYNRTKIIDIVKGFKFELDIAERKNYDKLSRLIVSRINGNLGSVISQYLYNDIELLSLLVEINKMLDDRHVVLDPLNYALMNTSNLNNSIDYVHYKITKLARTIKPGSRLALYGAGKIGSECYKCIKNTSDYHMVMWFDRLKAGEVKEGEILEPISRIKKTEYDVIIIAIDDWLIASGIKRDLLANEVSENKILIWSEI